MRIRKFLSIALALILLSQMLTFETFANDSLNEEDLGYMQVLSALNICELKQERASESLIGAEFVSMIVKAMGYNEGSVEAFELPYDDTALGLDYMEQLCFAYEHGVLNENVKKLGAYEDLTSSFALDVAVNALGYKEIAQRKGSALSVGISKEILRGVHTSAGGKLTYSDACRIIYNLLSIEVLTVESIITDSTLVYETTSGETFGSYYLDIKKVKGRLNATGFASVTGALASDSMSVIIGDKEYRTSDKADLFLVGNYVEGFAYEDTNVNGGLLVDIFVSNDDSIVISEGDFISYDGNTMTYYDENDKVRQTSVRNALISYNGENVPIGQYSESLFDIENGEIQLCGERGNYDFIKITSYKNIVAGYIDYENEAVYDDARQGIIVNTETDKASKIITLTDENGAEIAVSDIKKGDLLTFAASLQGNVSHAIVSSNTFSGKIETMLYEDNKIKEITIAGIVYELCDNAYGGSEGLKMGFEYVFYLNPFGKIAVIKMPSVSLLKRGFLLACEPVGTLKKEIQFLILEIDGEDEEDAQVYVAANSVRVDGEKCKEEDIVTAVKAYNGTAKTPILFRTNEESKIVEIDTPYYDSSVESEGTLVCSHKYNSTTDNDLYAKDMMSGGYTMLGYKYFMSKETARVLQNDEGVFMNAGKYPEDQEYDVDVFTIGTDSPIAAFVLRYDSASGDNASYENTVYVVSRKRAKLDEEGMYANSITLVNKASVTERNVKDYDFEMFENIALGSLVRVSLNAKDEIIAVKQIASYNDIFTMEGPVAYISVGTDGTETVKYYDNHATRMVVGKVYNIISDESTGKKLLQYYIDETDVTGSIETQLLPDAYIVEIKGGKVELTKADENSIRCYKSVGDSADKIFIHMHYDRATSVFIFR